MCPLFYFYEMSRMQIEYDGSPILNDVISLDDLKEHLRVEHTEEDDLITAIRAGAIAHVEHYCGIKLGTYAATGYLDHFEDSVIPGGPINSLTDGKRKNDAHAFHRARTLQPERWKEAHVSPLAMKVGRRLRATAATHTGLWC